MVALREGFEAYPPGSAPPYPPLVALGGNASGIVTSVRSHSGTQSLTGNIDPAVAVPIFASTIAAPCDSSAWVYLTRRAPGSISIGTPDLGLVLPGPGGEFETVMIIGFADGEDVFGMPLNSVYTIDSRDTFTVTPAAVIPANGWYQYRLSLTAITPTLSRVRAQVVSESGTSYLDHTFDLPTTTPNPATWILLANATVESWFDDIAIGPEAPAPRRVDLHPVRRYPRDDGEAMSCAPRLYPPPRAGRVFGGHE